MRNARIESLNHSLSLLRSQLLDHPVYRCLTNIDGVRRFMEHHVFAVWDFMSLLTYLQRCCSCVEIPWVPKGEPALRRLINEIVCGEESDQLPNGRCVSHYELYLQAMREAGAETRQIERFVSAVQSGCSVAEALEQAGAPAAVRAFVRTTFEIIAGDKPHAVAAAFTFGRENLLPQIYAPLVSELAARWPGKLDTFILYLNRHIELDGDEHGPLALTLVSELCGDDAQKWQDAQRAAVMALAARLHLWDAVTDSLAPRL